MRRSSIRLSSIPLLLLFAATAAHAEDFNITVPVQLTNLPSDVVRMMVFCSVYTNEPRLGGSQIGRGDTMMDISGGAYSGSPTIRFNADAGRDPALATHYQCTSYFIGRSAVGAVPAFYFQYATSPTFPLAAGAPFRLKTDVTAIPR